MDRLTLDQIKTFSDKNRIKIWDILKEEKPAVSETPKPEKAKELK